MQVGCGRANACLHMGLQFGIILCLQENLKWLWPWILIRWSEADVLEVDMILSHSWVRWAFPTPLGIRWVAGEVISIQHHQLFNLASLSSLLPSPHSPDPKWQQTGSVLSASGNPEELFRFFFCFTQNRTLWLSWVAGFSPHSVPSSVTDLCLLSTNALIS